MKIFKSNRKKRGAALVEYGLLVAGVALTTAAAVSILGHKTNDMVGVVAGALPSSNVEDTGKILGGRVIATTLDDGDGIGIDFSEDRPDSFSDIYGTGADGLIYDKLWGTTGG